MVRRGCRRTELEREYERGRSVMSDSRNRVKEVKKEGMRRDNEERKQVG